MKGVVWLFDLQVLRRVRSTNTVFVANELYLGANIPGNDINFVRFRLQQKSMTLNDLKCQFTAASSVVCALWQNGWS